jgi:hypothetical protein
MQFHSDFKKLVKNVNLHGFPVAQQTKTSTWTCVEGHARVQMEKIKQFILRV